MSISAALIYLERRVRGAIAGSCSGCKLTYDDSSGQRSIQLQSTFKFTESIGIHQPGICHNLDMGLSDRLYPANSGEEDSNSNVNQMQIFMPGPSQNAA